jgi:putative inorganic carbon (HCO3(-)) transporter
VTGWAQRFTATHPLREPLALGGALIIALGLAVSASVKPLITLLVIGAILVVVICNVRVEVAVLALVALGPLELAFPSSLNSQLTPTKIVGALAFVGFALNAFVTGRRIVFDRAHGIVLAILALAMLSTLQTTDTGGALTTTTRYGSFVALFFVVSQFVGDHRLQRRIAWALSIGSTITGFLAVREFLSGKALLARLPEGDPNDVAFVLATTLPLTLWLLREPGVRRVLASAMVGMISVAVVLTFSRGALVGLGAGLLWKLLVDRGHLRVIVAGGVTAATAILLVVFLAGGQVDTGLKAKGKIASNNVSTRLQAWHLAAKLAAEKPLLGIGPGQFRNVYGKETDQLPGTPPLKVVHNAYLDVAAELGVVAAILFLAYLALVFVRAWSARVNGRGPPGFAGALTIALLIGSVSALTLSEQYYAPFWLLGALATALWHEQRISAAA